MPFLNVFVTLSIFVAISSAIPTQVRSPITTVPPEVGLLVTACAADFKSPCKAVNGRCADKHLTFFHQSFVKCKRIAGCRCYGKRTYCNSSNDCSKGNRCVQVKTVGFDIEEDEVPLYNLCTPCSDVEHLTYFDTSTSTDRQSLTLPPPTSRSRVSFFYSLVDDGMGKCESTATPSPSTTPSTLPTLSPTVSGLLYRPCNTSVPAEEVCGTGNKCARKWETIDQGKYVPCSDRRGNRCQCYGVRKGCHSSTQCEHGEACSDITETRNFETYTSTACVLCPSSILTPVRLSPMEVYGHAIPVDSGNCSPGEEPSPTLPAPTPSISTSGTPTVETGSSPGPSSLPTQNTTGQPGPSESSTSVCISVDQLRHLSVKELVFSSHRRAAVLCDVHGSCATPGHIVVFNNQVMMMKKYCANVNGGCQRTVRAVNSPRMKRRMRVESKSPGLQYTALAASCESAAEEQIMKLMVRLWA